MKLKHLVMTVVSVLCVSGGMAVASAYEWINPFSVSDVWTSLTSGSVTWTTNTSGNFYEYRTVYFATTTNAGWTPSSASDFREWTACRHEGSVDGTSADSCTPTTPYWDSSWGESGYIWVRVSTNYQGCGSYTPTPDTVNCGHYNQKRVTIVPAP